MTNRCRVNGVTMTCDGTPYLGSPTSEDLCGRFSARTTVATQAFAENPIVALSAGPPPLLPSGRAGGLSGSWHTCSTALSRPLVFRAIARVALVLGCLVLVLSLLLSLWDLSWFTGSVLFLVIWGRR